MTASLEDLLAVPTADEELETFIGEAADAGFPARSWQSGSVPRTILEIEATTHSALSEDRQSIAKGGFLDLAEGGWLTLLAAGVFQEDRVEAVKTQGVATLTAEATAGPYTIAVNTLWISDASDRRFTNATGGTLTLGGTLELTWEAEEGSADYNVPNETVTTMVTPLAGVTVDNPDPGDGSWITVSGADEEADEALRQRCRDKWSTLGTGSPASSYRYWALAASDEVRRVSVREHDNLGTDTDGHVTVILAGSSAGVSAGAVTDVETYIEDKRPVCAEVHVASATTTAVTISGTVTVAAASATAAEASVSTNLTTLASEIEIGGTVYLAAIIEQIMEPAGVINVVLTSPTADAELDYDEVVSFTNSLTFSGV
jgi:phage-related baseplate assembly protein